MIVGGFGSNDWEDPFAWKEWVMKYKGWSEEEFYTKFYSPWMKEGVTDEMKHGIMEETGVHIFNWNEFGPGGTTFNKKSSEAANTDWAVRALYRQMSGMKDITLLGHSKGGNVVLSFVQGIGKASSEDVKPKNAVILDAPSMLDIAFYARTQWLFRYVPSNGITTVNVYGNFDPANGFSAGFVVGAINHMDIWGSGIDVHSVKSHWADTVLNKDLQVQYDHGARDSGPY